jgi:hypothetical protein
MHTGDFFSRVKLPAREADRSHVSGFELKMQIFIYSRIYLSLRFDTISDYMTSGSRMTN